MAMPPAPPTAPRSAQMGMGPPAVPAPQRQLACSNPDCLYTTTCPTYITRQTLPTMRDEWNPRGGPDAVGCPEFLYCPTCLDNDQNPVPMAVASAERASGAAANREVHMRHPADRRRHPHTRTTHLHTALSCPGSSPSPASTLTLPLSGCLIRGLSFARWSKA